MTEEQKAYFREYYKKNIIKKREQLKKSHSRPSFKKHKKEYNIKYRAEHRELLREASKRYE